jgi:hypothetical protein
LYDALAMRCRTTPGRRTRDRNEPPPRHLDVLSEQPVGSIEETIAYYAAINAPPTLTDFMTRFGFPGDETSAVYYNLGDLGIGREMHCRATETPAGGLACYVRNYGTFGGTFDDAIAAMLAAGPPLATVAMVYTPPIDAPNAVSFIVYGPDGSLVNEAQLDTRGDNKSIPQNCLNCHGGRSRYDLATHASQGARFLPFDPSAFAYAEQPDLTLAAQEGKLRQLNRLVNAAPTSAARSSAASVMTRRTIRVHPHGWNASPRDARFIASCHHCQAAVSFERPERSVDVRDGGEPARRGAGAAACAVRPAGMPTAEATTATSSLVRPRWCAVGRRPAPARHNARQGGSVSLAARRQQAHTPETPACSVRDPQLRPQGPTPRSGSLREGRVLRPRCRRSSGASRVLTPWSWTLVAGDPTSFACGYLLA